MIRILSAQPPSLTYIRSPLTSLNGVSRFLCPDVYNRRLPSLITPNRMTTFVLVHGAWAAALFGGPSRRHYGKQAMRSAFALRPGLRAHDSSLSESSLDEDAGCALRSS
jgi:hypothetical protein